MYPVAIGSIAAFMEAAVEQTKINQQPVKGARL